MTVIGSVESLWRYPVKSMRGEELREAFLGFGGVYGDRIYAFRSSTACAGFPYLTGREREEMLLFTPSFRDKDIMARPPNLAEAAALGPGITAVYPDPSESNLDIETPSGEILAIDSPHLINELVKPDDRRLGRVTLHRSDRAMTDCRPVSLFSVQTAQQLGQETGSVVDKRRFRANVYIDLGSAIGFGEDAFVGRKLRIGDKVVVAVMDRDPRCKMITLDPDTAEQNAALLRTVNHAHDNKAGVYGAVLVEGLVHPGDEIVLAD